MKPAHLKIIEGTFRPHRGVMLEGPAIQAPVRPRFLKGRAAKIWDEMVAAHPLFTEFQFSVLESFCPLKAEHETDPKAMATPRIVELRRQRELLLAPRGKVEHAEAKDPAEAFFDKDKKPRPG